MRAGASGYVLKQVGNEELIRAIRAAHRGEMALDTRTASQVIKAISKWVKQWMKVHLRISRCVKKKCWHCAEGDSNKEIGVKLTLRRLLSAIMSATFSNKLHSATASNWPSMPSFTILKITWNHEQ